MSAQIPFPLRAVLAAALIVFPVAVSHAIDFRSLGEPAILFDTPSDQGRRMFIIAPGTPVEVVVELDAWIKVRDPGGAITWVARQALSPHRTLMVTSDSAIIRSAPEQSAPAVFEAARELILDMVAPPSGGWVHVRHRDGPSGFIRANEVWGL